MFLHGSYPYSRHLLLIKFRVGNIHATYKKWHGFYLPYFTENVLCADIKQKDTEKMLYVLFLGLAKTYIFTRKIFQFDNFLTHKAENSQKIRLRENF